MDRQFFVYILALSFQCVDFSTPCLAAADVIDVKWTDLGHRANMTNSLQRKITSAQKTVDAEIIREGTNVPEIRHYES